VFWLLCDGDFGIKVGDGDIVVVYWVVDFEFGVYLIIEW